MLLLSLSLLISIRNNKKCNRLCTVLQKDEEEGRRRLFHCAELAKEEDDLNPIRRGNDIKKNWEASKLKLKVLKNQITFLEKSEKSQVIIG